MTNIRNDTDRFPLDEQRWKKVCQTHAFSPQQIRCVKLILCDYSNDEIAASLNIGVSTVRTHILEARKKTGSTSRMHLVLHIFKAAIEIASND